MFEALPSRGGILVAGSFLRLLAERFVRARALLLAGVSAAVLLLVLRLGPVPMALLVLAALSIPLGLRLTRPLAPSRPVLASVLAMAPLLVCWVLGKLAIPLELLHLRVLFFVGLSFVVVKAWTTCKDYNDGRLSEVDPVIMLAYILFFPTYVAGPMHLYQEFDGALREQRKLSAEEVIDAVFRILLGFVKVRVVAALLKPLSLEALASGSMSMSATHLVAASFVYSVVIWADFSGYSDLAIGAATLLGVRTPENFDRPYVAMNPRDFWQRWHITFSRVLTNYIFVPLTRALPNVLGERRVAIMVMGTVVTFALCGYWHGPTLNFVAWGLYHAAGLVVYDLYKSAATKRRLKKKLKPMRPTLLVRAVCIAATLVFVSLGWVFFVLPLHQLRGVW